MKISAFFLPHPPGPLSGRERERILHVLKCTDAGFINQFPNFLTCEDRRLLFCEARRLRRTFVTFNFLSLEAIE